MVRKTSTRKAGASKPPPPKTSTARSVRAAKPTAKPPATKTASGRTSPPGKSTAAAATKGTPEASRQVPARRKAAAAASPPLPVPTRVLRRAIFIDVENTSSETTLARVLEHLKIDRTAQPTDLTAMGNWKAVGVKLARMLAGAGAHLVHSAPAGGVRDWSDLSIAVAAGRWLALATPGDQLDLVSEDRAFDAVGDAAAAAGVVFRRLSYRHLAGAEVEPAPPAAVGGAQRPRRRGGRRRRRSEGAAPVEAPPAREAAAPREPTPAEHADAEAHAASLEQIRTTLVRLCGGDSDRWINLDALANALRAEGFSRPPGSPRLITRLRSIPGVEVSPNGMVRLLPAAPPMPAPTEGAAAPQPAPRRGRRTGTRGRSRKGTVPATAESADKTVGEPASANVATR